MFVMLSEMPVRLGPKHLPLASVAHEQSKNVIREGARFLTPLGMTRGKKFGQ